MNILVVYDGSKYAKRALETGIHMGKGLKAELHIYIWVSPKETSGEVFEFIKSEAEERVESAKVIVDTACGMVKKENLLCRTHISYQKNSIGEDIVEFAGQINAEYIVMGVRRRSKVEKLVFGSIAQYVVLHSPCPVTTVN